MISFNPKVSIIIPVYNGSNYLKQAIDSALAQTYENIEILVINDGSNDNGATEAIAHSYENRIRYFSKPNGGVASALNMGISQMQGTYFSWLSHDDIYFPEKITHQIQILSNLSDLNTIIYGGYEVIDAQSNATHCIKPEDNFPLEKLNNSLFPLLQGLIHGCTLLIPKKYFDEIRVFNESLLSTQDYDLWFDFFRVAPLHYDSRILIQSRAHAEQNTHQISTHLKECNTLLIDFMQRLTKSEMISIEGSVYRFFLKYYEYLSSTPFIQAAQLANQLANKALKEIKISVIIPFHNRIEWTLEAIDSVQAQTHQAFEIILVDDGSSEDISSILSKVQEDVRIKYIHQENLGPGAARNKGVELATGHYTAFLDSDDLFFPQKLETQLRYMEQNNLSFSYTAYDKIDEKRNFIQRVSIEEVKRTFPEIMILCPIIVPTVMGLTQIFKTHPFPTNINLGEDICLWVELASKFEYDGLNEPLSKYRVTPSTTVSSPKKLALSLINIATYFINHPTLHKYNIQIKELLYNAGVTLTYIPEGEKLSKKNEFLPKVSIIIPVYNGANYLREAIESALDQTYQNIEVLVINDGSNDNGATESIAHSFGSRIRYFNKPNGGVASALNMGISLMTGDYFSWLSHDDLYIKEKIEQQIKTLSEMNSSKVILYSNYSIFTTDPNKDTACYMRGVPPERFRYWITFENCLHGCTLLIPKAAFAECGLFNEKLQTTQDYDLWFRIAEKYQFIHLPFHLVKSRSHPEQGSITMRETVLKECNKLLSNFVRQLSAAEIQQAAYCSGGLGYAQLASSMWYRGYFSAGRTSALLALKHSFNAPLKETILAQCILAKGMLLHYIAKPIKKMLPARLRIIIKNSLKSTILRIKSSLILSPCIKTGDCTSQSSISTLRNKSLSEKFSTVYEKNLFGGRISRSGEGSDLVQTAIIRKEIPNLLKEFKINSMLDAPCGDWYWMKHVNLNIEHYIGVDIVKEMINNHQKRYANNHTHFECINLVEEKLPKVDLIFSRDCLVHLSNKDALNIIKNFKASGATYLLTTTFVGRTQNEDLGESFWRALNMQLAPFNFPTPLKLINEECTEENNMYTDKSLGLWRLADLLE